MAKKKHEAGETKAPETKNEAAPTNGEGTPPKEAKAPAIPKAPSFYLQAEDGTQYKFDMLKLPKKAAVAGKATLDGVETSYQVTSNKGFTPEANVLYYSWFTLPNGKTGYITHDYNVQPTSGAVYTVHEGKASRKNPDRVPKDDTVGKDRVAKFQATMATRKAGGTTAEPPKESGTATA